MTVLITLTTDGGDREDGNVYYARHVIVDAPQPALPAVREVIRAALRAGPALDLDGTGPDADHARQRFNDTAALVTALAAAGYPAEEAQPTIVTAHDRMTGPTPPTRQAPPPEEPKPMTTQPQAEPEQLDRHQAVNALTARQDAALRMHRDGCSFDQTADALLEQGYGAVPADVRRAVVKADIQAAIARERPDQAAVDRMLQVISAGFGARLIIRVPPYTEAEQMLLLQQTLAGMNPGARFTILACAEPVQLEQDLVEEACDVLHEAYEAAAADLGLDTNYDPRTPWAETPEPDRAAARSAVGAMLRWVFNHPGAESAPAPARREPADADL